MYIVEDCFYLKKHEGWVVCVRTTNEDAENFPIQAGDRVCGADVLKCELFTRSFAGNMRSVALLVNRQFKRGDVIGVSDSCPSPNPGESS